MPSTKQFTESAIDRLYRETVNIVNATLCTPEVRSRGIDEDIVQDIWVDFLSKERVLAVGMSVSDAMYEIDAGRISPDEGAVIGSFYRFVINIGLNKRERNLGLARRNESGGVIEDKPDDSRRSYEDNEEVLLRVEAILDHFRKTTYGCENGHEILVRRFFHGESITSIAESLGKKQGNLSNWLHRQLNALRQRHTDSEY